jgi:hypothetical protein
MYLDWDSGMCFIIMRIDIGNPVEWGFPENDLETESKIRNIVWDQPSIVDRRLFDEMDTRRFEIEIALRKGITSILGIIYHDVHVLHTA